jgi:SulP family sulfate permease
MKPDHPVIFKPETAADAWLGLLAARGIEYLFATVILGGILQVIFGLAGTAQLMRLLPRSVMVGFVNALAILIFLSQLPHLGIEIHSGIHLGGVPLLVFPLVALGLLVIVGLPKLTSAIPAPLVAIAILTGLVLMFGWDVPDVSDEGELPSSLPSMLVPDVPFTLETLKIIAPYAFAMAMVGLLESLMTAKLVDDITDTPSNKHREATGQGIANVISGFTGGMGGCAMIGQTMINVKISGARTRISTFCAGAFLMLLIVGAGDLVGMIPMAALVAVMIMVSVGTYDWHSTRISTLKRMPRAETAVMLTTVAGVVVTHNLAIGVVMGTVLAFMLFARRVYHLVGVRRELVEAADGSTYARYTVTGELFFASSNDLYTQFDYS